MFILSLTLRHLLRHWRLNLALLLGLTLAAALVAGLPAYAGAMAAYSLQERLLSHSLPAERNISVETNRASGLNVAIYGLIEDGLGEVLIERVEVRETLLEAYSPPRKPGVAPPPPLQFQRFRLWGFERLGQKVRLVDGRLPAFVEPASAANILRTPPQEVAIGADAAARTGLRVGDAVTATSVMGPIRMDIVGILEPLEPDHDMWWGVASTFGLEIEPINPNEDMVTLSLLAPPQTLQTWFPQHTLYWRILVDTDRIDVENAPRIQGALTNLQAQLRTNAVTMRSALPKILVDFQAELATARMALFLLVAQAFVFVLYTLWMITSFLLERSEGELATLAGRGGSRLQLSAVFCLEGLALALLAALLLGPYLAAGILKLWGMVTAAPVPPGLSAESTILALIAAGFGWLAIALPAYLATRRTLLEWQYRLGRPERLAGWQRLYLDVVLLIVGGLVYWQLSQSGSFIMSRIGETRLADPFLLLGSSVLLIAVAMVFLRIFPALLSLVAWWTKRGRGLVFSLGLSRLARAPLGPSRVMLLISLAAGLSLFTNAFVSSLGASQAEMAHYLTGADMRLSLNGAPTAEVVEAVSALPGVLVASPIFRGSMMSAEGRAVSLLAVDPDSFPQVARYPAGTGAPAMDILVQALRLDAVGEALASIYSRSALPPRIVLGGQLVFSLAGRRLGFEIDDVVDEFPTMSGTFIVTNLRVLEEEVDLGLIHFARSSEIWLRVDPTQYDALAGHPSLRGRVLGDAQAELRQLQADAMSQGTTGAFQLNTLVLSVLSVAGFLMVHYFAARQRNYEFGLLRAMGLTPGQILALLVAEGALVVGLGLLAGTVIGYSLAGVMMPYLSRALATSLAGVQIQQVVIDWPGVLRLYGILVGTYALGMGALLLVLARAGLHRVLRLGEE